MSEPVVVDLFAEDAAHESFLKTMLMRLARQAGKTIALQTRSARGGHPHALKELGIYQKVALKAMDLPTLLVVAIDANCKRFATAKGEIEKRLETPFKERALIACPDPHIERWYLADPQSFFKVVGTQPSSGKRKCERERYKKILSHAVTSAGHPPTLGGIEFASEIVEAMDLYRAGRAEPSLKDFLNQITARLRSI